MGILEDLEPIYSAPDPNPYRFAVGQTVRLRKGRSDDGQTPEWWDGARALVVRRYTTGMHKEHWYVLKHTNGKQSEFCEDEIDSRYSRRRRA